MSNDAIKRLRAWDAGTASCELPITYSAGDRLFAMDVSDLLEKYRALDGLCQVLEYIADSASRNALAAIAERDAAWKTERAAINAADEYEVERDEARAEATKLREVIRLADDVIEWTGADLLSGPDRSFGAVLAKYREARTALIGDKA